MAWMPVFSSMLSTTEALGAWRYSWQIALTFSRVAADRKLSHF
jgi:hypothetical protein